MCFYRLKLSFTTNNGTLGNLKQHLIAYISNNPSSKLLFDPVVNSSIHNFSFAVTTAISRESLTRFSGNRD